MVGAMAETQRRPVPRNDGGELDTALAFLTFARESVLIRGVGDPGALAVREVDGRRQTLRWVVAHVTSETARHAGHADILREQLDGTTGR
jgi:hypothetical protein